MNRSTRRLLGGFAAAVVIVLAGGWSARAASPNPVASPPSGPTGNEMLSVQPSLISVSARAGSTTSVQLTLRAAAELAVSIRAQGLGQGTDGSFKSVADAQDTTRYTGRAMLAAAPQSLTVKPGDSVKVDVGISVPENVGEGTRYAILTIMGLPSAPGDSANVGFGVELGVSAIIQVTGTTLTKTGQISAIDVGEALPGQPLPVNVAFLNTGNTHYGAVPNELVTSATLQDAAGEVIATAGANGNQLSVIPTFTRDVALSMTPSSPLVPGGRYHLEVGVGLRDGTIFDRKAIDFTWAGGEVLGATSAPITQVPVPAAPAATDPLLIVIAALVGAAIVVILFFLVSRIRRRSRPAGGTAAQ